MNSVAARASRRNSVWWVANGRLPLLAEASGPHHWTGLGQEEEGIKRMVAWAVSWARTVAKRGVAGPIVEPVFSPMLHHTTTGLRVRSITVDEGTASQRIRVRDETAFQQTGEREDIAERWRADQQGWMLIMTEVAVTIRLWSGEAAAVSRRILVLGIWWPWDGELEEEVGRSRNISSASRYSPRYDNNKNIYHYEYKRLS
jgi:hypothetical protein